VALSEGSPRNGNMEAWDNSMASTALEELLRLFPLEPRKRILYILLLWNLMLEIADIPAGQQSNCY
jgi:hypothetical protein